MSDDGSEQVPIPGLPANPHQPSLSPDGDRIAFRSDRGGVLRSIFVMDANGTNIEAVTPSGVYARWPAWSPDGEKIAYFTHAFAYDIWQIALDGGSPVQVTSGPAHDELPTWSPDGSMIAFTRQIEDGGDFDIYSITLENGAITNLTRTSSATDIMPRWGPN